MRAYSEMSDYMNVPECPRLIIKIETCGRKMNVIFGLSKEGRFTEVLAALNIERQMLIMRH